MPAVKVVSISDYRLGAVHFQWFHPETYNSADDFLAAIRDFLKESPSVGAGLIEEAQSWQIWEYRGFFGAEDEFLGYENPDLDALIALARAIDARGDQAEALVAWVMEMVYPVEEAIATFDRAFQGMYDDLQDFALDYLYDSYPEIANALGEVPGIRLDVDHFREALESDGWIFSYLENAGEWAVFREKVW